jgi:CPA2 family monovalent cation:H+ antiporter-2
VSTVTLLATVLIIVVGKSLAACLVVRLFGHSRSIVLTISASLAQIGEFYFILAGRSVSLGLLPEGGLSLILAGAIISILLNPLLFSALDRVLVKREKKPAQAAPGEEDADTLTREPIRPTDLTGHVVLVGHGRVGSVVAAALRDAKIPSLVIESDQETAAELHRRSIETIAGNAADPAVLRATNLASARCLLVAIPDALERPGRDAGSDGSFRHERSGQICPATPAGNRTLFFVSFESLPVPSTCVQCSRGRLIRLCQALRQFPIQITPGRWL